MKFVRDIFMELLATGKTINSDTPSSNFKLKPGRIEFKLNTNLHEAENIKFFKADLLQNMEILNYSVFITVLEEKLKKEIKALEKKVEVSKSEKGQFKKQIKLTLCTSKCYCCKRLCDVDMRLEEHHNIHRCGYGHQMRAISGVRI